MKINEPLRHEAIRHRAIQKHHNPYFESKQPEHTKFTSIKQWIRRDGWALIGSLLLIVGAVYYRTVGSQRYVITDITIQPTQFIPQERIQQTISEYEQQSWLWLIPRNTYWTVHPNALEQQLTSNLAQEYTLDAVDVTAVYPNSLLVTVNERVPSIQWITTSESGEEHHYSVDRNGVVASTPVDTATVSQLPTLYDKNRITLENGWWVISSAYIDFLLQVQDQVPLIINGATIQHYELPKIDCTERRVVAEKIFENEILESSSEEFKQKKRDVQERFKSGELSVDQSLEELERVKQEELQKRGEDTQGNGSEQFQWAAVTVDVECDLVKVATELHVVMTVNDKPITLYLDRTVDLTTQLENALTIIRQHQDVSRIDVRIPDRAYVQ